MRPLISGLGALALVGALLSGCGDDGDDEAAAFCDDVEALQGRFAELGTGSMPEPEVFTELSAAFDELAGAAPDAIEDDMTALAGALGALADIFEDIDLSDPSSMEGLQDQAAELQEQAADVEEASANVQAYLDEECGIDLQDAVPVPGDGTEGDGDAGDDGTGTEGTG